MQLTIFMLLFFALSLCDIRDMRKNNQKKELVPYIVVSALTLVFGIVFLTNPHQNSIAHYLVKLFNGGE